MTYTDALQFLTTFIQVEAAVLLIGFAAVVGFQLLAGKINTRGMFSDKGRGGGLSAGRVQLLVITVSGLIFYATKVIASDDPTSLPDIPTELAVALGASNVVYLGGKLHSVFGTRLRL